MSRLRRGSGGSECTCSSNSVLGLRLPPGSRGDDNGTSRAVRSRKCYGSSLARAHCALRSGIPQPLPIMAPKPRPPLTKAQALQALRPNTLGAKPRPEVDYGIRDCLPLQRRSIGGRQPRSHGLQNLNGACINPCSSVRGREPRHMQYPL